MTTYTIELTKQEAELVQEALRTILHISGSDTKADKYTVYKHFSRDLAESENEVSSIYKKLLGKLQG